MRLSKYIFIIFILITFFCNNTSFAVETQEQQLFTDVFKNKIISQNGQKILIRIEINPEKIENLKETTAQLVQEQLKDNIEKIIVLYQQDEYSYGKIFMLSTVHIKAFLKDKSNTKIIQSALVEKDVQPLNINPSDKLNLQTINAFKTRKQADIFRKNKQYKEAQRIYKHALMQNPFDYYSFFWLGEISRHQKNYPKAKDYYHSTLKINPGFKAAKNALKKIKINQPSDNY